MFSKRAESSEIQLS